MRQFPLLLVVSAFSLLTPSVHGIVSGSDVAGSVGPGDWTDSYTIEVSAGAVIRAAVGEVSDTDFDPAVEILSPTGAALASSYSNSTGTSAYVASAPVSGTYTIVVSDYSSNEAGNYNLSVFAGAATQSSVHDNYLNASSGSDFTGKIDVGELDILTIEVPAGAVINAAVGESTDTGFDPSIEIISPTGGSLGYSYSNSTGTNAYVASAPVSGTYAIVVSDQSSNESGHYHLSVVAGASSQSSDHDNFLEVTSGSDFSGRIERGDLDVLTIHAPAGAVINAAFGEAVDTIFDPAVQIISPTGASLDHSYSTSTGTNAYVASTPVSGLYTIIVSDNGCNDPGDYQLSVVVGSVAQSASHDNFLAATSGSDFTGRIERGELDVLTITAPAGAVINASIGEATETIFDPAIQIISPTGASLNYSYSTSTGTNAYVASAPISGLYTIIVSDNGCNEPGDYHLSVAVGGVAQSDSHDNFLDVTSGSDFSGRIERGELDVLTITAPAGAVLNAAVGEATDTIFDPAVQILSPTGAALDYRYSTSTGTNAYVASAPVSGTYTIIVSDDGCNEPGEYNLSVVVGSVTQSDSHDNFLDVTSGSDLCGRIERGEFDVVTIDAPAGAVIRAGIGEAVDTSFDPAVQILSPAGASLGYNYTTSSGTAAYVASAPASGRYAIVISDDGCNDPGDYLLSVVVGGTAELSAGDNTSISNGETHSGALQTGESDAHAFGGMAGEVIQITLADTRSGNFSPEMELLSPAGNSLGIRSHGTHSFTLPATGNYFLIVYDSGHNAAGNYQVSASGFTGNLTIRFVSPNDRLPKLHIGRLPNGSIEVWWSATYSGWTLQKAASLDESAFTDQTSEIADDRWRHVVPHPSGRQFFRLTR
ncbi:hypothetical protein ACFQY0_11715 [Haloferula chungangensis]|uniref:Peptidase C-terminal archaeal/bacterial domain-containing protein n=1 Tax=Haloferula chungangensis TaxID=1048331 RepID=A0ABW2L9I9_9BACT